MKKNVEVELTTLISNNLTDSIPRCPKKMVSSVEQDCDVASIRCFVPGKESKANTTKMNQETTKFGGKCTVDPMTLIKNYYHF